MNEFTIKGENGNLLKIEFDAADNLSNTTGYFGRYDTECVVEIKVGGFAVKSTMYSSTGDFFDFYKQLALANEQVAGSAFLRNYEQNLELEIKYDINGKALVSGNFSEYIESTTLKFEFLSDQSYIQATLRDLRFIVDKYGDNKGIK